MSGDVTVLSAPMSPANARALTERIRAGIDSLRADLLALYNGQGWLALGYESFHAYVVGEFPDRHPSTLHRLLEAARVEETLALPVGESKESHMRELAVVLGEDRTLLERAYMRARADYARPTAAAYRKAALEVWVEAKGPPLLARRLASGELAAEAAYGLSRLSLSANGLPGLARVVERCAEVELARLLAEQAMKGGEVWREVRDSLCVPGWPEAIPLERATAANLLAWLDVDSAERRARHAEGRRDYYVRRDELVGRIVAGVRERGPNEPLFSLVVELDSLSKGDLT